MPVKDSMITEELAEKILEDIKAMSKDEKAHLRAKLSRAFHTEPKQKIAYRM
jgi:hypothetical protein